MITKEDLLKIIKGFVREWYCNEVIAKRNNFVDKTCENQVTHLGKNGDTRCNLHLNHFEQNNIEFIEL